jgi:hypothetical protein
MSTVTYRCAKYTVVSHGEGARLGWILAKDADGFKYWLPAKDCYADDPVPEEYKPVDGKLDCTFF